MSVIDKIDKLGSIFRGRLGDAYLDAALDYLDYNELGLAFETLNDYLVEFDIAINQAEFDLIQELAEEMEMVLHRGEQLNLRYLEGLIIDHQ